MTSTVDIGGYSNREDLVNSVYPADPASDVLFQMAAVLVLVKVICREAGGWMRALVSIPEELVKVSPRPFAAQRG